MEALSNGLNSLQVAPSSDVYNNLTDDERESSLQQEIDQVRQVNDVMEGVLESINTAETNLGTVLGTAKNANNVLDTWIKILSQTEHTKELLFNNQWRGASKDDELQQERELALERRREQEKVERERKQRQEELAKKKNHDLEEKKRLKNEALQRRIYGRRATTSSTTSSAAIARTQGRPNTQSRAQASSAPQSQKRSVSSSSSTAASNTARSRIRPPTTARPQQRTASASASNSSTSSSRIQPPTGIKRNAAQMRR